MTCPTCCSSGCSQDGLEFMERTSTTAVTLPVCLAGGWVAAVRSAPRRVLCFRAAVTAELMLFLTRRLHCVCTKVFAGSIDEEKIMSTIDAMAELKDAGYTYVNVVRHTSHRHMQLPSTCLVVCSYSLHCGWTPRTTTGWSPSAPRMAA